jgi:hypothetical protein
MELCGFLDLDLFGSKFWYYIRYYFPLIFLLVSENLEIIFLLSVI